MSGTPIPEHLTHYRWTLSTCLDPYSVTRLLDARAMQLEMGAMPLVEIPTDSTMFDHAAVARKELCAHKLPMQVNRWHQHGYNEVIDMEDPRVIIYPENISNCQYSPIVTHDNKLI